MTDSQDSQPTEALSRRALREEGGAPGEPPAPKSGGLAALIRKHPNAWLAGALGVAFMLLGTGAVFAGIASGSRTPESAPVVEATIPPRPQPSTIPAASHLRTCSVASV
ncbi:MAG: hypothetical protein U1E32_09415, partial [Rhodoglobus sp.]|nr:hypothetical protein [Rhodoglobus sp.]